MNEFVIKDTILEGFRGPRNVERIEVPSGVTRIGEMAFWGYDKIVSVKLPPSVTEICDSAFSDCSRLEYINLPPNLERIGEFAFAKCSSLKSVDLPRSLSELGSYAFFYAGLKTIDIPGRINRIRDGTFSFCSDLETVWIRPGVREMEAAFFCCFSLKTVHIPDSLEKIIRTVTEIGTVHAFDFCGCLEKIEASDKWKEAHPYLFARIGEVVRQATESTSSQKIAVAEGTDPLKPEDNEPAELVRPKRQEKSKLEETQVPPDVATLVSEAVIVINDMLEVGWAASIFSDIDYEGFLIVVEDARPPFGNKSIDYGFYIKMCSVSNLAKCLHKHPRIQENPKNWELVYTLKRFAEKYADYYDSAEEAYIYCTKNTVSVPKKLKKGQQPLNLLGTLYDEVRKHCPLADFEGTPIHTKNVYH